MAKINIDLIVEHLGVQLQGAMKDGGGGRQDEVRHLGECAGQRGEYGILMGGLAKDLRECAR